MTTSTHSPLASQGPGGSGAGRQQCYPDPAMPRGAERFESSSAAYMRVCELAMGGMGRVDLALRKEGAFRRLYAVKRLHPHLRTDDGCRAMFLEEARIAGLIRHPNVVSVLDVGEDDQGPYLIMDFVDGLALNTLLGLADERQHWLPIQVCVRIGIQVARGLHAAHELTNTDGQPLNLVHRDLSPQNILLSYDGVVRITDFGIAKAIGRSVHTSTGMLKGKLGYMSPEQLRFEEPDRRSDLFALGVLIYELVTGGRLYRNDQGADGARRILTEPPPDIRQARPEVPESLVGLLFELLAKERHQRPPNAAEVAQRLEEVLVELLQLDSPVELPEFLEQFAGDVKDERKRELTAAIERLEAEPASRDPTVPFPRERIAVDPSPTKLMEQAVHSARVRWVRGVATAVAATAAVVGLVTWAWYAGGSSPEPAAGVQREAASVGAASPPSIAASAGGEGVEQAGGGAAGTLAGDPEAVPPSVAQLAQPDAGVEARASVEADASAHGEPVAEATPDAGARASKAGASSEDSAKAAGEASRAERRRAERRRRLRRLRRRQQMRAREQGDDRQGGSKGGSGGGLKWEEW